MAAMVHSIVLHAVHCTGFLYLDCALDRLLSTVIRQSHCMNDFCPSEFGHVEMEIMKGGGLYSGAIGSKLPILSRGDGWKFSRKRESLHKRLPEKT